MRFRAAEALVTDPGGGPSETRSELRACSMRERVKGTRNSWDADAR